jgi:hypothetical protein
MSCIYIHIHANTNCNICSYLCCILVLYFGVVCVYTSVTCVCMFIFCLYCLQPNPLVSQYIYIYTHTYTYENTYIHILVLYEQSTSIIHANIDTFQGHAARYIKILTLYVYVLSYMCLYVAVCWERVCICV